MIYFFTVACAALTGLSFLGSLHPVFDSLAVFRLYFIFPLLLCLLFYGVHKRIFLSSFYMLLIILCICSTYPVKEMLRSDSNREKGQFSLYQKNLSYPMKNYAEIISDIQAQAADFITLQEVTNAHTEILSRLKEDYPYQNLCPFSRGVGGVAILSKFPVTEKRCFHGMSATLIQTPEKKFWLTSLHTYWPWPYQQPQQIQTLLKSLQALNGDKIIAGDFNMVKWSYTLQNFTKTLALQELPQVHHSYFIKGLIPIAIDQAFVSSKGYFSARLRPYFGSDHKGLFVQFSF